MAHLHGQRRTQVETQIRIPNSMARILTPYFCKDQESESESVPESVSGNVNEPQGGNVPSSLSPKPPRIIMPMFIGTMLMRFPRRGDGCLRTFFGRRLFSSSGCSALTRSRRMRRIPTLQCSWILITFTSAATIIEIGKLNLF